jgi:hypothetical protein
MCQRGFECDVVLLELGCSIITVGNAGSDDLQDCSRESYWLIDHFRMVDIDFVGNRVLFEDG